MPVQSAWNETICGSSLATGKSRRVSRKVRSATRLPRDEDRHGELIWIQLSFLSGFTRSFAMSHLLSWHWAFLKLASLFCFFHVLFRLTCPSARSRLTPSVEPPRRHRPRFSMLSKLSLDRLQTVQSPRITVHSMLPVISWASIPSATATPSPTRSHHSPRSGDRNAAAKSFADIAVTFPHPSFQRARATGGDTPPA